MSSCSTSVSKNPGPVVIRSAKPEDAQICGQICYEAFYRINTDYNFPPDFPAAGAAIHVLSVMFSHPGFYCVVAEQDGRIVGSHCLDERAPVMGIGPITVDSGANAQRGTVSLVPGERSARDRADDAHDPRAV